MAEDEVGGRPEVGALAPAVVPPIGEGGRGDSLLKTTSSDQLCFFFWWVEGDQTIFLVAVNFEGLSHCSLP